VAATFITILIFLSCTAFAGDPITRLNRRLYDVLSSKSSGEDRRAVLEILRETKPNLPAYWRH
jgi:hypothetical protein